MENTDESTKTATVFDKDDTYDGRSLGSGYLVTGLVMTVVFVVMLCISVYQQQPAGAVIAAAGLACGAVVTGLSVHEVYRKKKILRFHDEQLQKFQSDVNEPTS